jgi:hypothetical protein
MSDVTPAPSCTLRKHAPVLITESQVAFGTAAVRPIAVTRRRWLDTALMGGLGRIVTVLTQPRPDQPHRQLAYLEAARMSRAMDRL